LSSDFTAGPNPVARSAGAVGFYRQGGSGFGELAVYDVSGNVIRKISITDKSIGNKNRRLVGEWDLKDNNGRLVSEGTYLVRGAVRTADGKREKVSVVLGVR
jgi:flagellar hook assembly protein FlgD